jgi:hypothetical protein
MIDTLRPARGHDEFTSEENTAYTGLNVSVRRVPCWRRMRGACAVQGKDAG